MSDLSQLEKMINKLADRLIQRPTMPIDCQLWDEHDIAAYFKYSLDYTKKHIMSNKLFPPSRLLPTKDTHVPRWKASDVVKYAMAFDKATLTY